MFTRGQEFLRFERRHAAQPRGGDMIDTASPLTVEAGHVFPTWSDSQNVTRELSEAAAITVDSLPAAGTHAFEPLTPGIAALEFSRPGPVAGTTGLSPVINDKCQADQNQN